MTANNDYTLIVHYKKNNFNLLSSLCDKYGSDKGEIETSGHPYPWQAHTYTDYYCRLFDHHRLEIKRVFECGIGTNNPNLPSSMGANGKPGASLRVWRDYFPNAYIYGADIDRDILFEEDRISTFFVDQTCPHSVAKLWAGLRVGNFDLMVDDGLHTFEAALCLFENSFSKLANGGFYIIEDVNIVSLNRFYHYFSDKTYNVDFINLLRPVTGTARHSLVVIRHGGSALRVDNLSTPTT